MKKTCIQVSICPECRRSIKLADITDKETYKCCYCKWKGEHLELATSNFTGDYKLII